MFLSRETKEKRRVLAFHSVLEKYQPEIPQRWSEKYYQYIHIIQIFIIVCIERPYGPS